MKNLTILLFILVSLTSYSQTQYYTTDGKNRLTESEIKKQASEVEVEMEKVLGKKLYVNLVIEKIETKKDSIISKVIFKMNEKKQDMLFALQPLSEFIDKEFPKFELHALTGEKVDLEQLKGKPTWINLWFVKCAACIDEMPILNKIKEKYKEDLNFISITPENQKDVDDFLKLHPFEFQHLIDADKFIERLGVKSYPMNLFLDKNGVLRYAKGAIPYETKDGSDLKIGEGDAFIKIIETLK